MSPMNEREILNSAEYKEVKESAVLKDEDVPREPLSPQDMLETTILELQSGKKPQNTEHLTDIGGLFLLRYQESQEENDLDISILAFKLAAELLDSDNPNLVDNLRIYASTLFTRYQVAGQVKDIEEALKSLERVLELTPEEYPRLPSILNNLGVFLKILYKRTGDLAKLSKAIALQRRCIEVTSKDDPDLATWLANLAESLETRFDFSGNLAEINEAILLLQKSVQISEDDPNFPRWLNFLGNALDSRFERTGNYDDISESIRLQRRSIQLTSEDHEQHSLFLNNLGTSLSKLFDQSGDLEHISEAVILLQKSIRLTHERDPELAQRLSNLALALHSRWERTRDEADLFASISSQRECLEHSPDDHVSRPIWLNNFGLALQSKFYLSGDRADILEAISWHRACVNATPDDHADMPKWLNNLGTVLSIWFDETQDLEVISEAISNQKRSIELLNSSEDRSDLPHWLSNLALALQSRFIYTGDPPDISEAITLLRRCIQLTPHGHAYLPLFYSNLGVVFEAYFDHNRDPTNLQQAISNYKLSALSVQGTPSTKLLAARKWAQLLSAHDKTSHGQLLEAYHAAINLISQIAGLEKTIHRRFTSLVEISDVSSIAATSAIKVGEYALSLEWLEQGRCLVWNQLNNLRTPFDDLRSYDTKLANDITRVARALESSGSRTELLISSAEGTNLTRKNIVEEEAHSHIKLAREWEHLLATVRGIPQFSDFLKPASCSSMLKNIPCSGHVVVLNVHEDRSDAMLLTFGAQQPLHVPLPAMSYSRADALRRDLNVLLLKRSIQVRGRKRNVFHGPLGYTRTMIDILRELWSSVVKPILNCLGYYVPVPNLPRIWWCATGPLAFLPIHAAGIYTPGEMVPGAFTKLSDFAISSFIPTVRALIEINKKSRDEYVPSEKAGMLIISQTDPPGMPSIPGASLEVEAIKNLLLESNRRHHCLTGQDATVQQVTERMDDYSAVHFACHASQDIANPLKSGFYLHDGRLELSGVIRKQITRGNLAFLSACQTSTGDVKLSEEAVHLAGGMLAAGYRGVVATMWSINDEYAPKLAERFYRNMLINSNGFMDSESAARALHDAIQEMFLSLGSSEESLLAWVPYVHFGI